MNLVYDFHKDKETYHLIQYKNSRDSLVPFVLEHSGLGPGGRVLEVGSAEGGNLKPFAESGFDCTGVELSPSRVKLAEEFCQIEIRKGTIRFLVTDIYDLSIPEDNQQKFDLIFLKDVLEHIHNQEKLMHWLKKFLKPGGFIFLGFPSWYMPFGGHQQMCYNRFLARTPFFHLLPMPVYRKILHWFNRNEPQNQGLIEIKETGISIQRFERIIRREKYRIVKRVFYFVPPIYGHKFGLKTRKLNTLLSKIPLLREFFISSAYYLLDMDH